MERLRVLRARWKRRRRARRPLGWRALFSLVPLSALLLAGECVLRLGWQAPSPQELTEADPGAMMVPHESRIWGLRPGVKRPFGALTRVNPEGLRETELRGSQLRILTLGDSSLYGHGLENEDTLHQLLADRLDRRSIKTDVLCGAIPGYSILQTRRLMEEIGWSLRPDLLVVGNLWSDNNFEQFQDRELLQLLDRPLAQLERPLWESRLWLWLRLQLNPPARPDRGQDARLHVHWVRDPHPEARRRVSVEDYARGLDELLREAAERGVGAVVLRPVNRERLKSEPATASWEPYFEAQARVAEARGVQLIDLALPLRQADLKASRAFLDEMHPSGRANQLLAEDLARHLVDWGWPGERLLPQSGSVDLDIPEDPWGEGGIPYRGGAVAPGSTTVPHAPESP